MQLPKFVSKLFQSPPPVEQELKELKQAVNEMKAGRPLMTELMPRDSMFFSFMHTPFNPDVLVGKKGGLLIYEKMRQDDTIKACLNLKKYAVLSSGWTIEHTKDVDKAETEASEFILYNLQHMEGSFDDDLLEIMTGFEYGFCLHGDTTVHSPEGDRPIKEFVGKQPYVYCYDQNHHKLQLVQAKKVWLSRKNVDTYRVTYKWWAGSIGKWKTDSIVCTDNHPFLLYFGDKYKKAIDLMPGDRLANFRKKHLPSKRLLGVKKKPRDNKGQFVSLGNHKVVSVEYAGKADVYDMEVPIYHNFAANGVFVHNSCSEKIFEVMGSATPYNGKIGIKAIKTRKPHWIDIKTDKFGNIEEDGIIQNRTSNYPKNKFILYTHDKTFDNPYGESDLRACYRAWWSKDVIIKFWNMWLERFGTPPVIGKITEALESGDEAALKEIFKNLTSKTSMLLPKGVEVDIPEIRGMGAQAYQKAIEAHDMAIARSLLVPSLLGVTQQGNTGSYAQSKTHFNVFIWIIEKLRRTLEELINEQLIREVLNYNFHLENYPRFAFIPLNEDKKMELAKLYIDAISKGAITPTLQDENVFRNLLDLPEKTKEEVEKEKPIEEKSLPEEEEPEKPEEEEKQFSCSRELTTYEKKVDFKQIEDNLNTLETNTIEQLVEILTKQKQAIVNFLTSKIQKGELDQALVNNLQLKYQLQLQQTIREMLRESFTLGKEDAKKEIGTAKNYKVKIPPVQAIEWFEKKSFYVKNILNEQLLKQIKQALITAMEIGEPLSETMAKIENIYEPFLGDDRVIVDEEQPKPYRIETLVRTNSTAAMNWGRMAMYNDPELEGFVEACQFSAILDTRTTDICRRLDGKIIKMSDPDISRVVPPLHYNCFVDAGTPIFTVEGWKKIGAIEIGDLVLTHTGRFKPVTFVHHKQNPIKYSGDVIKIYVELPRRNGKGKKFFTVTVTPNHPLFVRGKWKMAGKIEEGDALGTLATKCIECDKVLPWFCQMGSKIPKFCSAKCILKHFGAMEWTEERRVRQSILSSAQLKREYANGIRDGNKITKAAHEKVNQLYREGRGSLQKTENRKLAYEARIKSSKFIKAVTIDRMGDKNVMRRPDVCAKAVASRKQLYMDNPEKHINRIMGRAVMKGHEGYISKGQRALYNVAREVFSDVELEYPVKTGNKRYYLDVALPKYKIGLEYDGSYWHQDLEKDVRRDAELLTEGWSVIHYKDRVPTQNRLMFAVNRLLANHNGEYKFTEVKVTKVERWKLRKPRRLYNIAVQDDESYIAKGFVVHNCRSLLVAVTLADPPYAPIKRSEMDSALQTISESFGGRIGND